MHSVVLFPRSLQHSRNVLPTEGAGSRLFYCIYWKQKFPGTDATPACSVCHWCNSLSLQYLQLCRCSDSDCSQLQPGRCTDSSGQTSLSIYSLHQRKPTTALTLLS